MQNNAKTLFDKLWDAHVISSVENGPTQIYIDRHFCHEVTSPQAFDGLRKRGLKVFRPEKTTMTADHNTPTIWSRTRCWPRCAPPRTRATRSRWRPCA